MKNVHLYVKETGAYIEDQLIFPRQEEIKENDELIGYKEVYDIPENSTELPLPQPNWKPVFKDGVWVETITQEELDELNKPSVPRVTEIQKLKDKVEFLSNQVADMILDL